MNEFNKEKNNGCISNVQTSKVSHCSEAEAHKISDQTEHYLICHHEKNNNLDIYQERNCLQGGVPKKHGRSFEMPFARSIGLNLGSHLW